MKTDLQIKVKELKEAQTDLQETRVPLAEKEYVVSVLENTKEKLRGTASHLVSTVNTKDVSMQNWIIRRLLIKTMLLSKYICRRNECSVQENTRFMSFASFKKLLSTELSYMFEKILQNKTLPFASKAELLRLTEEHICGLGRALNILTPLVELVLALNCQF
ncbi:hypothetical protein QYF61_025638 [Mycteria americana]|uniref:Uncharacterized protein n=1 Tax=Mycteria americana TaxID=33587 RepID=A0AAN7NFC5_MYCAM|nr:hypothetical protein QYF61_025638 [Mycteria americana]